MFEQRDEEQDAGSFPRAEDFFFDEGQHGPSVDLPVEQRVAGKQPLQWRCERRGEGAERAGGQHQHRQAPTRIEPGQAPSLIHLKQEHHDEDVRHDLARGTPLGLCYRLADTHPVGIGKKLFHNEDEV